MFSHSARRTSGARRLASLTASAVAALIALTACSSTASEGDSAPTTTDASQSNSAPAADDAGTVEPSVEESDSGEDSTADSAANTDGAATYPVVLETQFGEVTIAAAPERVVALTPDAADALISLGVEPIAAAADPASFPASHPWLVGQIDDIADASLVSATGEVNYEAIASTEPDLIVGATWMFTDAAAFERMNSIAPTVIANSTALNVDWDERLLTAAAAFGLTDKAETIISDIRDEFALIGAEVPGIESKTYQFVRADPDGFGFGNGSVLELFGLQAAPNQDNTQSGPSLSKENTAQLDADILGVWAPTDDLRASLDADPLFQALPAVANGTVFYTDLPMAFAANTPAPMALAWLKDVLAPTVLALA